ncbi:hypothetical protein TKK_0002759 [Trichogramma kaykai]
MLDLILSIFEYKLFWIHVIGLAVYYVYLKFVAFTYWQRKNVPHEKPVLIFGNILRSCLGLVSIGEDVKRNYDKFRDHPVHGIYMLSNPVLMVNDPELVRLVLVKEFSKFRDRGLYHNEKVDPLTANLFFLPGEKWKRLRSKLSPTFSSSKLKSIYPLIKEIGDELIKTVEKSIVNGNVVIEVKDLSSRYTTDTIVSMAFGFNCNTLKDPKSDFRKYGDMIVKKRPNIQLTFGMFSPELLTFLRIRLIDKVVYEFFIRVFSEMVNLRKKGNVKRDDVLNLLMQLVEKGYIGVNDEEIRKPINETDRITLLEAYAQAFVFFFAGFETSSGTIAYALYELALHPEIQDRVRDEIRDLMDTSHGCSYENCVNRTKYLEMVINETLRKHPTSPFLNRICTEDCEFPSVNMNVQKGTKIMISASGIMRNSNFYPDPDKFDPERFSQENIDSRNPYTFLPFGQGPRSCIGIRLGMIQTKIALISLLSKFRCSPCLDTPVPLKYSPKSIVQVPDRGIPLRFERAR